MSARFWTNAGSWRLYTSTRVSLIAAIKSATSEAPNLRRSRSVMERLGMSRDPSGDFDHPRVPEGNRLRPHVLYRLSAGEWAARAAEPAPRGVRVSG